MARIPQEELERLKREISVQRLVEAKGVKLRRHGKDLIGLCPLHNDTEPSLVVSPKTNLWNCLGACGKGGSVIDWVMCAEGVSFRHAVEILREGAPVAGSSSPSSQSQKQPSTQKVDTLDAQTDDASLLRDVVEYYHQALLASPDALGYLKQRGLGDEEAIRHFRLGFANRTLGYRLPPKNRKAGAELRGRLQQLGILRASGHEHFNGSLVIPVFDGDGQVSTLYGRKTGERLRAGTPLHLYLAGGDRCVWNLEGLTSSKEVILCESLIDALTFWVSGFTNVTTSYGVNGFSRAHLEAFEAYGIERVLIAYNRDEAGEKAAQAHGAELLERGIECHRVHFPKGMDANEYAQKVQPSQQSLDLVLRKAELMGGGGSSPTVNARVASEEEALVKRRQATKEEDGTTSPRLRRAGVAKSAAVPSEEQGPAASPSVPISSLAACARLAGAARLPEPERQALPATSDESVLPQSPSLEIPTEIREAEIVVTLGDRRYRVRGMDRNLSYETLKINLAVFRGEGFHVDSLELYSARQRSAFLKQASMELGVDVEVLKRDVGRLLLKLEELQDAAIREALSPQEEGVAISELERDEALSLLRDPQLLERIGEDLGACGLVGEESNKLVAYLVSLSRKLEHPLAVVIQSSSAAGKSTLMDAVLAVVPEEDRVSYSAMTGQSLYYLGEKDLKHKVLAVAEEEGAERASYALKLLQSEGELSIASTGKDPVTGRLQTQEYHVEGPVALMLTTTAIEVDEELLNRCLVLTVDEGRSQTRAIHERQRERRTLFGLQHAHERVRLRTLHQNAQRLLEPLRVVNPYAPQLDFLDVQARTRRDHEKYLTLIDAITFLHQHQRERGEDSRIGRYVVTSLRDIELANILAVEVLGRCLDELPPQTRRLLLELEELVEKQCQELSTSRTDFRFTRRFVREALGWGDTQLRVHLLRLVELEYLLVHNGSRGRSFVYEFACETQEGGHRPGEGQERAVYVTPRLADVEAIRTVDRADVGDEYDTNLAGLRSDLAAQEGDLAGPTRPQRGAVAGGARGEFEPMVAGPIGQNGADLSENAHLAYQQEELVVTVRRASDEAVSG